MTTGYKSKTYTEGYDSLQMLSLKHKKEGHTSLLALIETCRTMSFWT